MEGIGELNQTFNSPVLISEIHILVDIVFSLGFGLE
jgi:hypothetical protein